MRKRLRDRKKDREREGGRKIEKERICVQPSCAIKIACKS